MTRLALGIDLGTSGVRSAVLDRKGNVLAMARGSYGSAPQARRDPACWWTAVADCLKEQIQTLRDLGADPADISGIAVDGTSGSLVLTDPSLSPVTRALMYDDGGLTPEADRIAAIAPAEHVARGPSSALARALRLLAEDKYRRASHLLHQADFIAARLLGRGAWTDLNNALKTGLDPATAQWPEWMNSLDLPAGLLPKAVPPGTMLGTLNKTVAKKFGLSPGTRVHAGTTDSIAAFLAAADPAPAVAVTSLGTTLAVKLFSNVRIDDPALGLYSHKIGDGWLVGGASNTGGSVLGKYFSVDDLNRLSRQINPNAESSLDYYPLSAPGERFPINDPTLAPRMSPRPPDDADFLHALFEGMARIEKRAYQAIADRGGPHPGRVITAGGGAVNDTWRAIRARVLGVPVEKARATEAAVGAARLVGFDAGARAASRSERNTSC